MLELNLERLGYFPLGTYGTLTLPDGQILFTVEQPWNNNKIAISCIPIGSYEVVPRPYYRGGYDAMEITAVNGRSHILIHIANTPSDVMGCIGLGSSFGFQKGQIAVNASKLAFTEFMRQVGKEKFILNIVNKIGGVLD